MQMMPGDWKLWGGKRRGSSEKGQGKRGWAGDPNPRGGEGEVGAAGKTRLSEGGSVGYEKRERSVSSLEGMPPPPMLTHPQRHDVDTEPIGHGCPQERPNH